MRNMRKLAIGALIVGVGLLGTGPTIRAQQNGPLFIGLGDSLGEGVQSGDANALTQPFSYIDLLSILMGAPVPLPLIQTWPLGSVESVAGRVRFSPNTETLDLAVSGADTGSLLTAQATATSVSDISNEIDLVEYPRTGSQIQIAEALHPQRIACWIGANDALGAVTAYDQLDGSSQLTPLSVFAANFSQIAADLASTGAQVVFGTIPSVTKIAFLINAQDLQRLTGSSSGLPANSYTTLVTAMTIKLGLLSRSVLSDPNYVLDPSEVANINQRIAQFNDVIQTTASQYGMGVADVAGAFDQLAANPPVIDGVPLTTRFLGGLFSLDGIHPSNIGQLIIAELFVQAFNHQYGLSIPDVPDATFMDFFLSDPFIDRNGNGQVAGRPGAGLLETVGPLLGWSGDTNDVVPNTMTTTTSPGSSGITASPNTGNVKAAVSLLESATGIDLTYATRKEKLAAVARALGIRPRSN